MNVRQILSEQFKDLITEETLTAIEETFVKAVNDKAKDKTELAVKQVRESIDKDHSTKLKKLVESIDKDHSSKLKKLVEAIDMDHAVKLEKVVQKIDEKHTGMLQAIVEKYEGKLKQGATTFKKRLVEDVSNYIDIYIDKVLPKDQINEAVKNIKASKILAEVRQMVGISEEFVDSEVREALVDGKQTIDSLRKELNESLKSNTDLLAKANKAEAKLLLAEKTQDMPETKKAFVSRMLKGKTPEYIIENLDYVVSLFEKENEEEVDSAREEVRKTVHTTNIDRPEILEEEQKFNVEIAKEGSASDTVQSYLTEMQRTSKNLFAR